MVFKDLLEVLDSLAQLDSRDSLVVKELPAILDQLEAQGRGVREDNQVGSFTCCSADS